MRLTIAALSLVSLLVAHVDAKLTITSGKVAINGAHGTTVRTENLNPPKKPKTLVLGQDEGLRLTFTVHDDEKDVDVQPHQTFLRFWDEKTEEEGIVPIKVAKDGKAKFTLNLRKPPVGLPPTSDHPLNVTLLLGSYTYTSNSFPLFDISLPPSGTPPPHPEEFQYAPQPEIFHTFRAEQKHPFKVVSLIFAALAVTPWAILLALLSNLPISMKPDSRTAPFIGLLTAVEGLLLWYWVDLKIYQVLAYGAVLGLVTAAAGKRALSAL
ncbi:hypothetical protein FRC02_003358 [Tulasnella sp. 418]|nr:hypothetical protein FRC02_003358 [Tulasnella sp. 418]